MLEPAMGDKSMVDYDTVREGARGGVVNLLRMAKVHCAASVAFSALRTSQGTMSVAAYPDPEAETPADATSWSMDVLLHLVHRVWEAPELVAGMAHTSTRTPAHLGLNRPLEVEVIAVPLCDASDPHHPWGVLGVAREHGAFDDQQAVVLRGLGQRLTAYLRAREQLIGSSAAPSADQEQPARPLSASHEARAGGAASAADRGSNPGYEVEPALRDFLADAMDPVSDDPGGTVVLMLFDARSGPAAGRDAAGSAAVAAEEVRRHVRHEDLVLPSEQGILAVAMRLSSGAVVDVVRRRLSHAVASALGVDDIGGHTSVALSAAGTNGVEELLAQAYGQLGSR
jgi:hypothetical protein